MFALVSCLIMTVGHETQAQAARSVPFTLVYTNTFNAPLGKEWNVYGGVPACCPSSLWVKSNAVVANGELQLQGRRELNSNVYTTAGVSLARLNLTYGRWQIRSRFDKGLGLKQCALLWPAEGFQPPEIDFAESKTSDAERTEMTATLHYPPIRNQMIHSKTQVDFSQWHTWGVTWRPGIISYTLDGKTWRVIRDDIEGVAIGRPVVPTTPMHFGVQTTMGTPTATKPDSSTPDEVDLHIDWVKVWSYNEGAVT